MNKEVPKAPGAVPRVRRPAAAVSDHQQFDRELLGALQKAKSSLHWRIPPIPMSLWRLVPRRRVVMAVGLLAALIFVVPHTPLKHWSNLAIGSLSHNVRSRAAFQFIDDFTGGVNDHWDSAGLVSDSSGAARVTGFALNRNTMDLSGYRLDFDAKIASSGLGWVVGAADDQNYYAFKLEEVKSKSEKKYRLVRYLVSEGHIDESGRVEVDVPVPLNEQDYNRISVRLRENRIATFINGTGVDYWQAEDSPRGGVGFFTEGNETAYVRRVEISGNEDTWGLFLFGFLELIEDAKGFVQPITAHFLGTPAPDPNRSGQNSDSARLAKAF